MEFAWDERKAAANLSKHGVSFGEAATVKNTDAEMNDDLRPEYDVASLRVRKLGPERKHFGRLAVQLDPDVAELFPDAQAVNEALRLLVRIVRESHPALPSTNKDR